MSIKPVGITFETAQGGIDVDWFQKMPDGRYLYAIPDTHRVVSVEDLKELEDKLDFWINRADTRGMSESEYKTWLALGHQSKTARRLRAIIEDKPCSQS